MSSVATRTPAGSVEVRPLSADQCATVAFPLTIPVFVELEDASDVPSKAARRELLDAAFLCALAELGEPLNEAAQAVLDRRTDELYRLSLMARRPMRTRDFDVRLRAVLLSLRAEALAGAR